MSKIELKVTYKSQELGQPFTCHSVGPVDLQVPDLTDATTRQVEMWLEDMKAAADAWNETNQDKVSFSLRIVAREE